MVALLPGGQSSEHGLRPYFSVHDHDNDDGKRTIDGTLENSSAYTKIVGVQTPRYSESGG